MYSCKPFPIAGPLPPGTRSNKRRKSDSDQSDDMSDVGGFSDMEVDSPGPQPIPPIIKVLSDGKSVLIDHESKKQLILPGKNLWKIGEHKGCHTLECLSDRNISTRYVSKALGSSKATAIDGNIFKTKTTAASPTAKIRKTAKAPRSDSEEETSDDKDKEKDDKMKDKENDKEKDDKMKDKEKDDKMKDKMKDKDKEKKKTPKQEAADMSESKGLDSKDKHNKGNGGTTEVPEKIKDSDDEGPVKEAVDIS